MFNFAQPKKETLDSGLLQKAIIWIATAVIFALPLVFLPLTTEFYIYNKFILLVLATVVMLFLWTATFVLNKSARITVSPFTLPLLGFAVIVLVGTFLKDPSPTDALYGQTALVVALTFFYFIVSSVIKDKTTLSRIYLGLETTSLLLVIFAVVSITSLGNVIYPLAFMKSSWWTPMGMPLNLFIFLLPLFPLTLVKGIKEKQIPTILISVFLLAGLVFSGYHLLPGKETSPNFLSQKAGWDIALDVFKSSPLLGTGPEGFNEAYTRFRPAYLNNGDQWTVRYGQSSSTYVHLLTTTGMLGFVALMLLVFQIVKHAGREILNPERKTSDAFAIAISLIVVVVTMLFIPPSFILLFLLYLLLALFTVALKLEEKGKITDAVLSFAAIKQISSTSENQSGQGQLLPWLLFIPSVILAVAVFYFGGRSYLAEITYRKALLSIQENKGSDAYATLISAINLNPRVSNYHRTYSQINLALANTIAGSQEELTDKQRADIVQLVQQAIREAKAAATLNPTNVVNWENLAATYRQLINVAKGSDQWTIASYVQAIRLDPTNPNLRIQLGGVFFALGDLPRAQAQFVQAAGLKPDFANAHYNLALVFTAQKDILNAVKSMETTLSLVKPDSEDFTKAQSELESLRKLLTEQQQAQLSAENAQKQTETLSRPEPVPTTSVNPPLELNEEAAPEIPEEETATGAARPGEATPAPEQ